MEVLAAVCFAAGAADYLTGSRLNLGQAFYKGISSIPELLLLMAGFMALTPWIGANLFPPLNPIFDSLGCDPSLLAGILLSCDTGGAVLGREVAASPEAGIYGGMIVSSLMGCTISCTIPLILTNTRHKKEEAIQGLLMGCCAVPFASLLTGFLCRIPAAILFYNTWPLLLLAAALFVLFLAAKAQAGAVFAAAAFLVRATALFGLSAAFFQESAGVILLDGLTPLNEILPVICRIGLFLGGILPFFHMAQRILAIPLAKCARLLGIGPDSMSCLILALGNSIPVLMNLDELEPEGVTMNAAFAAVAAFAVGDHLAFAMQFAPEISIPLMAGKVLSGITVLVLCRLLALRRS